MIRLSDWDLKFQKQFADIPINQRNKAGGLLPLVPLPAEWDDFLKIIKHEWGYWKKDLSDHSYCLLMLYDGLAFYEYEDNTFWPQFAKAVGLERITGNFQTDINSAFSKITQEHGLYLRPQDYNGTAIYHIGIPLSLWDDFLNICEWAFWNEWENIIDEEWEQIINKLSIGRPRLGRFLINNREAAQKIIKEMLDARRWLDEDPNLQIHDLSDAFLFCKKYIDEVPETTAEFLRPQDPESLLKYRAQVIWDQQRSRITVHLPPVPQNKLPAMWQIGNVEKPASSSADEIVLNTQAFEPLLNLQLKLGQHTEIQRLRGLYPFGLFDLDNNGRLINPKRNELPLRNYMLVSKDKITDVKRKEFDDEYYQLNEEFELTDGTICYTTNLSPTGKYAELDINHKDCVFKIQFRRRSRIEARFFVGENMRAANFSRMQDKIKMDGLPLLCVSIPCGYFQNTIEELNKKFKVSIDNEVTNGKWEKRTTHQDEDREFYFWRWSNRPLIKQVKSGTIRSFERLGECFKAPDLKGDRIFSIEAPNIKEAYNVYVDHSKYKMKDCWKNLPDAFLPWFLLCQTTEGMKWDDLLLARDIIAPNQRLNYNLLRKYEQYGLLKLKGRKWIIEESRAVLEDSKSDGNVRLKYCGDPSLLWNLYRRMHSEIDELPLIEVIDKRGKPPYLQMVWRTPCREMVKEYLRKKGVRICNDLWNP